MARPRGQISKPPKKPRGNFPLFAHRGGSWCATVGGQRRSFGGWRNDPRGVQALANYKEYLRARDEGRQPEPVRAGPLAVRDVVNALLKDRDAKRQRGELEAASYADYRAALRAFLAIVGPDRSPYDLTPADFARVKDEWAATRGAHALGRWVQLVRTAFKHAGPDGIGLMDRPPRYGGQFAKPVAKLKRRDVRRATAASGKRLFTPAEVQALLAECRPLLRACVLLGLNCGFLAIDCARLTAKDVDLDGRWLEFVRQKTETPRAAVLWPETVEAIRAAIDRRGEPRSEAHADLLFLTREGRPLVHETIHQTDREGVQHVRRSDALNQATRDALDRAGIKRKGVSFAALRKTFRTTADEAGDAHAVHLVMGHALPGMAAHYVVDVIRPRLEKVAEHVRARLLLPTSRKGSGPAAAARAHPSPPAARAGSPDRPETSARRRHARGNGGARPTRSKRKGASRKGRAA